MALASSEVALCGETVTPTTRGETDASVTGASGEDETAPSLGAGEPEASDGRGAGPPPDAATAPSRDAGYVGRDVVQDPSVACPVVCALGSAPPPSLRRVKMPPRPAKAATPPPSRPRSLPRRSMACNGRRPRPSRCPTAPASMTGTSFRRAKGAKAPIASSATPSTTPASPLGSTSSPAAESEHCRDHELREHESGQGLAQPACPVRGSRPCETDERKRQEQRSRRDRRRANGELEPEHEGHDRRALPTTRKPPNAASPKFPGWASPADEPAQHLMGRVAVGTDQAARSPGRSP